MSIRVSRLRVLVPAIFALSAFGLVTAASEPDLPTPKDVKESVDALRDAYEKHYKAAETDAKAKKDLAKKLYTEAPKRKTPAMQYASYDEARQLAAGTGDIKLTLDALVALSTKFPGVDPNLAPDTLKLLGDGALVSTDDTGLIPLATEAGASALDREDFATAVVLGKLLATAAKKAEDPDATMEARKLLSRAESLTAAVATIKTKPNDPAANETLGQYWTFTRGRWDMGLKYLEKAANKDLAAAAAKDLANPKTSKERAAVADAWYKLARDYRGAEHRRVIDRAWEWYSAALVIAAGDEELKVGERVKEIEKNYPELFNVTFAGHTGATAAIAVTPNGKTLVSVSNDNSVRLWDATTGRLQKVLEGHTSWVGSVVLTPDSAQAVTAGGDNTIRVWDLQSGKEVAQLKGHAVAIRGLALTADGKTLISGASDKTCRAWDLKSGKELKRYGEGKDSVESVAVTPDGKSVLVGNDAGVVTVYDAKSGDIVSKFDKHDGMMVYTIVTSADGKTAISGARGKDVHVWDIATGKELRRFKGHTEQVYQIALSPDGKLVASASFDKTVRIWDFESGKELKKLEGHADGVQGVCFTPDSRFVLSASWDKTVRKWRLPLFPSGNNKRVD
ncbi:WD40 repeat domain-containing protein [Gemmata sp. G18]|uniref:WD40 repeat domain-containing protein n=1 Tax=Gemmata palustris TaxID=2822762 RepID=A0ABS5BUC1_9BACT|nr:WD40 repeat domain-containing protein [Gemmata palustris]MBP3957321.1 WD40 repeat domain-containing protein [Gemmata palustris]